VEPHGRSPCLDAEVPGVSARRRGLLRRRIKNYLIFGSGMSIICFEFINLLKGGEEKMSRIISTILSLMLIGMLAVALVGCGADIKAENEKLKAENTSLKSDNDKFKLEIQKLKEEIQKAAEKDATITSMKGENDALKQQVEDLKAQVAKRKKK
jgi:cell division protein FtsB